MVFFHQDNRMQISILEYLLFEMGLVDGISSIWKLCQISSCEILGSQKSYFFRCFLPFFSKPTQNLKLQQCPPEDLKVLLLGLSSLTVKPLQIPQNLGIPVQIPFDRFYRQIYSPRATWSVCSNFYLKWLRATPESATSILKYKLKQFI